MLLAVLYSPMHAIKRRQVKDTLVAVATEAASLLASALF
jgi:hypothetical protein